MYLLLLHRLPTMEFIANELNFLDDENPELLHY